MKRYHITPVPYPRQTGKSRFNPEHAARIERFHAFRDEVRLHKVELPDHAHIVFEMPVPKGRKYQARIGQPHLQRPDADNLTKALFDSASADDAKIWDYRATKIWAAEGAIVVLRMAPPTCTHPVRVMKKLRIQPSGLMQAVLLCTTCGDWIRDVTQVAAMGGR